jgi:hypothetical protein
VETYSKPKEQQMAKTLFSVANGAVTVIEDSEIVTLSVNESLAVGGGQAAGILVVKGSGSVVLNGPLLVQLGFALINAKLPTSLVPMATALENLILKGLSAIA